MSKQKEDKTKNKTNAMRMLDTKKIPYTTHTYECDEFIDAIQIADLLGLPHEKVTNPRDAGRQQKLLCVRHTNSGGA